MLGIGSLSPDMMWGEGDDELMGGPDPLSIRLNNPGAIRQSSIQWAGMAPDQSGPFVNFATPEAGILAMSKNLDSYARKHGLTTIEGIVNRWAPPSENNTNGYVKRVADAMGVDPTQPLNLADPAVKSALMEAMATVEAGKKHYTRDQIASVITGQPGGAPPMPQPTPYDEDQGLANIAAMGQRVAAMRPPAGPGAVAGVSALPDRPQAQGLSGLNPYLQIASQLMPERQGRPWADALINAGAAMMQSNRPDFLGGLGAGLQAGNQALMQGQNLARQDTLDRFKLGMQLAQFDQKDGGEYAMSDGVLYNKKTGQTQQVGSGKAPQTREVKRGDKIITQEWNGAMWRDVGEAPRSTDDRTLTPVYDPNSPTGVRLVPRDQAAGQPGPLPPGWSVEVGKDGQVRIVQGAMGGRPTQTDPVTGLSNEVLKELDKNLVSAQGQAMQVNRFAQQFKPIYQTIPERGRMWGTALQERLGMDPGPDAKASLAEFTRFKAEASQFFADRLKEMSGGAVTDGEAARQMAYLPTPGTGLFDGDSPSEFSAKTERLQGFFDAAAARLAYIRKAGIGISSMKELESKVPLEQVPKLIRSAIDAAKSDLAKDYPNASPETLESYAVRRVARDFGLMDNSPLLAAPAVKPPPPSGSGAAPGPRELPPSDAEIRRQQQQQAPVQPQSGGGILPQPKRFDLGGPKVGAQPQGEIPTFTDPNDPALAKLPSGSVFRDGSGTLRYKP